MDGPRAQSPEGVRRRGGALNVGIATALILAGMGVALALLLLGERADRRGLALPAKLAASAGFVALGVLHDAPWPMLAALAVSLMGDAFLVSRDARFLRAGIGVFLLAHLAYMAAFVARGVSAPWTLAGFALASAASFLAARSLLPLVARDMRRAVWAYVVVLAAMMALAWGTREPALILAASLFFASDVLVARDRFAGRAFWHRLVGLPMYYGAQIVFALSGAP